MHCHYQFHGGLCFPCGYTYYKIITDWLTFSVHFATARAQINYNFAKQNIITVCEGFSFFIFIRTLTDWNESKACWWCIDCICLAYWYIFIIELWWMLELDNLTFNFDAFCPLFSTKIRMKRWHIKRFICLTNMFLTVNFGLDAVNYLGHHVR